MGVVIDLASRRIRNQRGRTAGHGRRSIDCRHCGENHPVVRLAGGEERCVTAFFDGNNWFCKNRGCREAWLKPRSSNQ